MRTIRARRSQRGFSLIEMMVVVAVIAVLAGLMISLSTKSYGANPRAVSDQIVATMNLAKLRAISTRRWHRVEVTGPTATTPNSVILWQWSDVGMGVPTGSCVLGPPATACWQVVEVTSLPRTIVIHNATTTVYASAGAASVVQDPSLDFLIDFRPDGSSTAGTVFLADSSSTHPWRVLVYQATGSSYARENW